MVLGKIVPQIETQKGPRVSEEYLSRFMNKPALGNLSPLESVSKNTMKSLMLRQFFSTFLPITSSLIAS